MNAQILLVAVAVGLLATFTMDIGSIIGLRLGFAGPGPRRTGPHLIGRWFGSLLRGKLSHADIIDTAPVPREVPLGLAVHYAIGIVLVLLYAALLQVLQAVPTFVNALVFGVSTTVIPWLYLYPAWGYGWLGANARGFPMTFFSLYNHAIYGLGIGLWGAFLMRA